MAPKTLTFAGTISYLDAARAANAAGDATHVLFDLQAVRFIRPCGMAAIAALLTRFLNEQRKVFVQRPARDDVFGYLQNMNFFRLFEVFKDEDFNRHAQHGRFARMTRIDVQSDSACVTQEILSCLGVDEPAVRSDLLTCLDESISNLWAHARLAGYAVAQSYQRGTVHARYEIAICDAGRGILTSLRENPDYDIADHATAVQSACIEGISGALYRKSPHYEHFGMGLTQIDRVAASTEGTFLLCSGDALRERTGSVVKVSRLSCPWQGTIVSLILKHVGIASRLTGSGPPTPGLRFG